MTLLDRQRQITQALKEVADTLTEHGIDISDGIIILLALAVAGAEHTGMSKEMLIKEIEGVYNRRGSHLRSGLGTPN